MFRELRKAFFIMTKKSNKNLYYFLFYLSFWYKLPIYYKTFSIYTKPIKIPVLLKDDILKSSTIVSNWIKSSILDSSEKKLYLKISSELLSFFKRSSNSKILDKENKFNQDLKVNIVDNVQYLQLYNWEFK